MARLREGTQMTRVVVRVPKNTLKEIDDYVLASGMYDTYFKSAALIIGARTLMRTIQFPVQEPPLDTTQLRWRQEEPLSYDSRGEQEGRFPSRRGRPPKRTRVDDAREGLIKVDPELAALTVSGVEEIE